MQNSRLKMQGGRQHLRRERLGFVDDVLIDTLTGRLVAIVVPSL